MCCTYIYTYVTEVGIICAVKLTPIESDCGSILRQLGEKKSTEESFAFVKLIFVAIN